MKCYINKVVTNSEIQTDVKVLIPDANLRRRMGKLIKTSVTTAVECLGSIDNISLLDAIITATGWGCLADSERFLRNIINDKEQFLNPTPFIQSTFNTIGGQIALLAHNHCYNVTYVNRSHSFEDALLDALMRIADNESCNVLIGAFDEQIPSQFRIMERMGLFRKTACGDGAMFAHLTALPTENSIAEIAKLDFPTTVLTEDDCAKKYCSTPSTTLLYNSYEAYGMYPTASAQSFAKSVKLIAEGVKEVVVYNEYLGGTPAVIVLRCIG